MEVIRKTYQALGDYLQIAAGTGEDKWFDFDLAEFAKRFSLDNFQSTYTLQALEQENILQMTEQMYRPSLAEFRADRETIEAIESRYPELEPLIKALLRTYTGIWDQPSAISEKQLCKILRKSLEDVTANLEQLMKLGILHYEPRKENPQVRYKQNRIRTEDLYINQQRYQARKKAFTDRVEGMIRYISDQNRCRTLLICEYFGESGGMPCGHCDHCKRSVNLSNETIIQEIRSFLAQGPQPMLELKERLELYGSKAMEILDFMISEGKLRADSRGNVSSV
jgi:ATP-dependent DNA helicase RecQ